MGHAQVASAAARVGRVARVRPGMVHLGETEPSFLGEVPFFVCLDHPGIKEDCFAHWRSRRPDQLGDQAIPFATPDCGECGGSRWQQMFGGDEDHHPRFRDDSDFGFTPRAAWFSRVLLTRLCACLDTALRRADGSGPIQNTNSAGVKLNSGDVGSVHLEEHVPTRVRSRILALLCKDATHKSKPEGRPDPLVVSDVFLRSPGASLEVDGGLQRTVRPTADGQLDCRRALCFCEGDAERSPASAFAWMASTMRSGKSLQDFKDLTGAVGEDLEDLWSKYDTITQTEEAKLDRNMKSSKKTSQQRICCMASNLQENVQPIRLALGGPEAHANVFESQAAAAVPCTPEAVWASCWVRAARMRVVAPLPLAPSRAAPTTSNAASVASSTACSADGKKAIAVALPSPLALAQETGEVERKRVGESDRSGRCGVKPTRRPVRPLSAPPARRDMPRCDCAFEMLLVLRSQPVRRERNKWPIPAKCSGDPPLRTSSVLFRRPGAVA